MTSLSVCWHKTKAPLLSPDKIKKFPLLNELGGSEALLSDSKAHNGIPLIVLGADTTL